jgi:hypothetical protein
VFEFLEEGEYIPTLTATEAVVVTGVGSNVEAWRFLIVKRAQSLERIHSGSSKSNVGTDDIRDVGARANLVNV